MLRLFTAYLCVLLCIQSCRPTSLSPNNLLKYIENPVNGLSQEQTVGDVTVKVEYQPAEVLIAKEIGDIPIQPAEVSRLRRKYDNASYFILSFSKDGEEILHPKSGLSNYSNLLQVFSFGLGQYIKLTTAQGDTIPPVNYNLDRTYHMGSSTNLLVAFPKVTNSTVLHFHIQEFGLGCGNLDFIFRQKDVAAVPALKY